MKVRRLNTINKLYTPASGTTVYIDYSASSQILEVEFIAGKVYHYHGVKANVWKEYCDLIQAGKSSGIFVNSEIKNKYKFSEIS